MPLIDLSHTLGPTMPRFSEAVPLPQVRAWMSHAQAAESGRYQDCSCEVSEAYFVTSIGTYMDSPYHFFPDLPQIHQLRLEQCVLLGLCIDCRPLAPQQEIGSEVLAGYEWRGKAVLLCTGWSAYWGEPLYNDYPFVGRGLAQALRDGGAGLVGVDYLALDDQSDPLRPAHTTLLQHHILIVENLRGLEALVGHEFMFHAAPVKLEGAAAFPVRAYAVMP
jgi:kynurenine formamidase